MTFGEYAETVRDAVVTSVKGLAVTFRVVLKVQTRGDITIQYPEEKDAIPEGSRGVLFNDVTDCIACRQCANACPAKCIIVEADKREATAPAAFTRSGTKKTSVLRRFNIDESLCCFCGLCVEACPTGCLYHTQEYEFSVLNREKHILNFLNYRR